MSFESVSMQALVWGGGISVILLLVSMVIIHRNKRFEKDELEPGINAVLFSLFLMIFTAIVYLIDFVLKAHPEKVQFLISIEPYIPIAIQIVEVGVMPLMAVCLLIGVFFLRENA